MTDRKWDVFISHASEDKEGFVRALADALDALGVKVWYDEFSLSVGDSLSSSIDEGLANSRFGIVIVSPSFISKAWPRRELQGLVSREIGGLGAILPVWHNIGLKEVLNFSPPLADKFALSTDQLSAEQIALRILSHVNPKLYGTVFEGGRKNNSFIEALTALQEELDEVRQELSEFKCPDCGAPLTIAIDIPLDEDGKHSGLRREFECGRVEDDRGCDASCRR